MTYADKYALLKAYKIITGDDPDQNGSVNDLDSLNRKLTPEEAKIIDDIFERNKINTEAALMKNYGITKTTDLTLAQRNAILKSLEMPKEAQ